MRGLITVLLLCAVTISCSPLAATAAETGWSAVGVRGGASADEKDHHLRQYEFFGRYRTPWELRADSGFGIGVNVELAAGVLHASGDYGLIASVGPTFTVGSPTFPVYVDLGVSAAGLTRDTFGDRDYNGYGQYISHGAINFVLGRGIGVAYRYQHMSNAGMNGSANPGVNLHLVALEYHPTP